MILLGLKIASRSNTKGQDYIRIPSLQKFWPIPIIMYALCFVIMIVTLVANKQASKSMTF